MKIFTKKYLIIGLIVLLVAMNISTIVTLWLQKKSQLLPPPVEDSGIEIPDQHLGRFFREQLNLSPEQFEKFRNFRQAYHANARKHIQIMGDLRVKMLQEMAKEKPDTSNLHQVALEIGQQHTALKKLTFDYYLNLKSVCNQEQEQRLFQIFNAMQQSEVHIRGRMRNRHMRPPGPRGPGRGRGWRFNQNQEINK